ncbi:hypothetical protein GQ54DRAFT_307580 [Martensiomyces pterosporus]|nr:hypothetical protein GQ54DRAFT_307580 [Martensiomyces pterosporus]
MAGSSSNTITGRLKEEPLVAVGTVATFAAFTYAAVGVYRGKFSQSQWGMRGRVVMQGLTVAALFGYAMMRNKEDKNPRKDDIRPINWERLEREAKAAEELEATQGKKSDPALEKLIAKAEAKKKSVFAVEASPKTGAASAADKE